MDDRTSMDRRREEEERRRREEEQRRKESESTYKRNVERVNRSRDEEISRALSVGPLNR